MGDNKKNGEGSGMPPTVPLIDRLDSLLMVVDVQEKLFPAVQDPEGIEKTISALIDAAAAMEVPVVFTEHCAESIGPTIGALKNRAPDDAQVLSKVHFRATAEDDILDTINTLGKNQIVLTGTEAHVCVLQTAMGLLDNDFDVFLVADAIASRSTRDRDMAMTRLADAGAKIVTAEMVIFEWLERGDTDLFSRVLPAIKALK